MADLFLSRPLCDAALAAALGLDGGTPDGLPGASLVAGADPALPMRAAWPDGVLPGACFACDADAEAALRYLAETIGWEVEEGPAALAGGAAADLLILPPPAPQSDAPWPEADWQHRWAPLWPHALREILGGRDSPAAAQAARIGPILTRAQSRAMAARRVRPAESGLDLDDVTLRARRRPYNAFFAVEEYDLTHRRFDGGETGEMTRAVFVAVDAVTVLPYDPARDRVLVIEQFRAGPLGRGDRSPWLLEPVAGRIEPGQSPAETALKETREEAGLELAPDSLVRVGEFYPSTGAVSEYLTAYVALTDLPDSAAGLHGLDHEHEDIRGHVMPRKVLMEKIAAGAAPNGPLMLTAFWLEANLGRLRGSG